MTNRTFLSGVAIAALAGALVSAPAHASSRELGAESDRSENARALSTRRGTSSDRRLRLAEFDLEAPEADTPASSAQPASSAAPAATAAPAAPMVAAPAPLVGPVAPVDTFAGFATQGLTAEFNGSVSFALQQTSDNFIGSVNGPESELIVRDDVGVDFGDPNNVAPYAVHIFRQRNSDGGVFFNCTGSVINPRTILSAAHCFNGSTGGIATTSSETYGLPGSGADTTLLIATGQSSADRLFTYLDTGAGYGEGGVASSTDVVIHPSGNADNVGLGFPWADIALVAVDSPITDVPALSLLLTPLTELTHVLQVGYGTNGTGLTGGTNAGSSFLRRIGENQLGLLGSTADYIDGVFPAFAPSSQVLGFESQVYYWTDFDNPDRTPEEVAGCDFTGTNINCGTIENVLGIDYFDGDALPLEAGTAPGDSGSPLVADQIADFPLALGVLSGGFDFFGIGNAYSDVSFYNPLFPFFEFITENTSYKYVSAVEGDGVWSDPTHWTQDLDPGFFIQDETGAIVNGIPTGNEPGIFASGPKLGTILGVDISGNNTDVTPGFEGIDISLPESSALLGPGSTGFVPQNTDGTPGVAFANPAQYFEVILSRAGTTTVDLDVEIDRLVIDNSEAGFVVGSAWDFTSLINVEQLSGSAVIDGTLNTPIYSLGVGELSGDGTINTNVLFNLAGIVTAGGNGEVGSLAINGDYVQTSGGTLWSDFSVGRRRRVSADSYDIAGSAVLDGDLIVSTNSRRARFGTQYTLLSAGSVDGDFSSVTFLSRSPILQAETSVEGGDVIVRITARSIRDVLGRRSSLRSLGSSLDELRETNFAAFENLFAIVDNASFDTFGATLASLAPTSAFTQSFTANAFSQRFTGQLSQRNLALRGGSRGQGGFSAAGNASFAIAGNAPTEVGKIGVFGTASGMFLNGGQQAGIVGNGTFGFGNFGINGVSAGSFDTFGGANAFEQLALDQAGEMTVGADMRVSEGLSFGVAVSNIRNTQQSTAALQSQQDRSQSVAIYASYTQGGMFADGYAGTSDQRLGVDRASQGDFQSVYASAIGQSEAQQTFGGMRLGYAFDLAKGFEVGPVLSMDYVRNRIGGYDELGAGGFGLSVADRTFTSLGAKTGAMASLDIRASEKSTIRAFGSVAYARELADTADIVTASFAGAEGTPFTLANELDPQWVSVNAGAEMQVGSNLTASISVTSDMGRGALSNDQAQFGLSWRF